MKIHTRTDTFEFNLNEVTLKGENEKATLELRYGNSVGASWEFIHGGTTYVIWCDGESITLSRMGLIDIGWYHG